MKKVYLILSLILIISCEEKGTDQIIPIDFTEINLECINGASPGGNIRCRIDTKEEYDSLYFHRYTKPLEEWFNANYLSLIDGVIRNYPDATPDQYDSILVNDYVYNFAPFIDVKDCKHPDIDFYKYTLLGQSIFASGCSTPKVEIEVLMDESSKELTYLAKVESYGNCEAGYAINKWILLDKLDADYRVIFSSEENNIP